MNFQKNTILLSLLALPMFNAVYAQSAQAPQSLTAGNVNTAVPQTKQELVALSTSEKEQALRAQTVALITSVQNVVADGVSTFWLDIQVVDAKGDLLIGKTAGTLEVKNGTVVSALDIDRRQPSHQIELLDGRARVQIKAPGQQQDMVIRMTVGAAEKTLIVPVLPHLRDIVTAGVIELRGFLNKLPAGGIVPSGENDMFERELVRVSESFNDEKGHIGARAAFYIKGKVKGEYLLSMLYDSDKDTRGQMFRDIDPEKFYPVYGDSSTKGVDAQSSGKFYLRIDKNRSYVLYGDFNTQDASIIQLGSYSRAINGIKWHVEGDRAKTNVFVSHDSLKQVVDEFAAKGVSGPYSVSNSTGVVGSERVELIVRDRNQPALILSTKLMTRYDDYEFEPFNGRIVFTSPVASYDANLNPIYIRVSYEIESGGERFIVAGVNTQLKLIPNFTLAASANVDKNPLGEYTVGAVAAQVRLGKTDVTVELAKSVGEQGGVLTLDEGLAARVSANYANDKVQASINAVRTEEQFHNQASGVTPGRQELNVKGAVKLGQNVSVVADAMRSEDLVTLGRRDAANVGLEWTIVNGLKLDLGIRQAKDVPATLIPPSTNCTGYNGYQYGSGSLTCTGGSPFPIQSGGLAGSLPGNDVTSVHAKLTYQVSARSNVYIESDTSTESSATRLIAIGAETGLGDRSRLYGRVESTSAALGTYGLSTAQEQRQGVVGLSSDYMTDGQVFNEYRMNQGLTSDRAENATGLRNGFKLTDNLKLTTGIEYLKVIAGTGGDAKAVTVGLDYQGSSWRWGVRLEGRQDDVSNNVLSTVSLARKLNRDWTVLAKNYNATQLSTISAEWRRQDQFQLGFAYRPQTVNHFNLLARYEYRTDETTYTSPSREHAHMVSVHTDWHPNRALSLSNRFAVKRRLDTITTGVEDTWSAWLVGSRLTYDLDERWSVGGMLSYLGSKGAVQYGVAAELGYVVAPNTMFNIGYNFRGLLDKDLVSNDYRSRGLYFGLRFKFDEDVFSSNSPDTNLTMTKKQ